MAVLLNAAGVPEPSPEIRRRLQAIHGNLDIRFVEGINSHWAVTLGWSNDDRRREWIQSGKTDPAKAFDIIGYLPLDCPVEEAPAYLGKVFREFPRQDVQDLVGRVAKYNEGPAQKAVEEALAEVLDSADPSKASGPKIQVSSAGVPTEKPKRGRPKKAAAKSKYL